MALFFLQHGELAGLVLLLLSMALGAGAEIGLRRFRSQARLLFRSRARKKRRPQPGTYGRFVGVLRIDVEPTTDFEHRPCAVATAAARPTTKADLEQVSTRAKKLVLVTEEGELVLDGPTVVVAPSRSIPPDGRTGPVMERVRRLAGRNREWAFDELPLEFRSLPDGARVEVAGRVVRRADDSRGYRESASTLSLEGKAGPILLAGRSSRVIPWRATLLAPVAVLLALALLGSSTPPFELLSPFHRDESIRALQRLPYDQPGATDELRLAVCPHWQHLDRARLLARMGRLDEALAEAEKDPSERSLRARFQLLTESERWPEATAHWVALVERVEGEDRPSRPYARTETPDWRVHTDLSIRTLYSSRIPDARAGAMVSELLRLEAPSVAVRERRISWMLELASGLILTGDPEAARRVLEGVHRELRDRRVSPGDRARFSRNAVHLEIVSLIRSGDTERCSALLEEHRGEGRGWLHSANELVARVDSRFNTWNLPRALRADMAAVERGVSLRRRWWTPRRLEFVALIGARMGPVEWLRTRNSIGALPAGTAVATLVHQTSHIRALEAHGARGSPEMLELRQRLAASRENVFGRW